MIKKDKIFLYNNNLYNYEDLHDLKYRYNLENFQSGELINIETGEIKDLANLKDFYTSALLLVKKEIVETEYGIPSKDVNYMINYLNNSQHKEFISKVESNPESVSDEEVIQYWKIKQKVEIEEHINIMCDIKDFIKHNSTFNFSNLSMIDKGRVFSLLDLLSYEDSFVYSRDDLLKCLEFENKETLRAFLKKLEDNEIIHRLNKLKKSEVEIIVNPFLAIKGKNKKLTYEIYKMFPKTVETYIGRLGIRYLEIDNNKLIQAELKD